MSQEEVDLETKNTGRPSQLRSLQRQQQAVDIRLAEHTAKLQVIAQKIDKCLEDMKSVDGDSQESNMTADAGMKALKEKLQRSRRKVDLLMSRKDELEKGEATLKKDVEKAKEVHTSDRQEQKRLLAEKEFILLEIAKLNQKNLLLFIDGQIIQNEQRTRDMKQKAREHMQKKDYAEQQMAAEEAELQKAEVKLLEVCKDLLKQEFRWEEVQPQIALLEKKREIYRAETNERYSADSENDEQKINPELLKRIVGSLSAERQETKEKIQQIRTEMTMICMSIFDREASRLQGSVPGFLSSLENLLENVHEQKNAYVATLSPLEQKIQQDELNLQGSARSIAKYEERGAETVNETVQQLKSKLKAKNTELQAIQKELSELKYKKQLHTSQITGIGGNLSHHLNESKLHAQQMQWCQKEGETVDRSIKQFQAQQSKIEAQGRQLQHLLNDNNRRLNEVNQKIEDFNRMQSRLGDTRQELMSAQLDLSNIQLRISQETRQLEQIQGLRKELRKLENERETIKERIRHCNDSKQTIEQHIKEEEEEIKLVDELKKGTKIKPKDPDTTEIKPIGENPICPIF